MHRGFPGLVARGLAAAKRFLHQPLPLGIPLVLELGELLPLVPTAVQVAGDSSRIQHFNLDRSMADFWRTPGGASVLLPKRDAVLAMLVQAFGPEAFVQNP